MIRHARHGQRLPCLLMVDRSQFNPSSLSGTLPVEGLPRTQPDYWIEEARFREWL